MRTRFDKLASIMNESTPEKVTVYRVAYSKDGKFRGFDYYLSRETAHRRAAEHEEPRRMKTTTPKQESTRLRSSCLRKGFATL